MPYHTNWKDSKPVQEAQKATTSNTKDTPDPLTIPGAHKVEESLWCIVCNLPHAHYQCEVPKSTFAQGHQGSEVDRSNHHEQTINMVSLHPYEVEECNSIPLKMNLIGLIFVRNNDITHNLYLFQIGMFV